VAWTTDAERDHDRTAYPHQQFRRRQRMATIKVRQNGSLLVDGDDVTLVDWNGQPYEIARRPFALCRCGASTRKPFCDGTHSKVGFAAAEAAVPTSVDRPAQG
jgi:CDGSH-type Zn-finger protein